MNAERHVKLFRNGQNQAVRILHKFEIAGTDAIMRKQGERLILEPTPAKSLLTLLASLHPLDQIFPGDRRVGNRSGRSVMRYIFDTKTLFDRAGSRIDSRLRDCCDGEPTTSI